MADMFERAAVWLDQQRRQHLSRTVTLQGAGGISVSVPAGIGSTEYETTNEYGAIERWESRDFVVTRSDLPRLPQPGDTVVETQGARTLTYEVVAPRGMPVWTPADSYGISIAIHTKLIGAL